MTLAGSQDLPLIPRKLLLGNASRSNPRLSPDGSHLAWIAPLDGVLNIWVAPTLAIGQGQPVTRMKGRPAAWFDWSADGRHVMFLKDETGDENYNFFVVDPETSEVRNLTQMPRAAVRPLLWSRDMPGIVMLGLNDRDAAWHDIWSMDLASGERQLVFENTEKFGHFCFDWQGRLRLAQRSEPATGGIQIYRFENSRMEPWRHVPFEDVMSSQWLFFNRAGTQLSMLSSIGRDTAALLRVDMASGMESVLAQHAKADLGHVIWDPVTFEIDAIAAEPLRQEWIILNPEVADTLALIRPCGPDCAVNVMSMSDDNRLWTIALHGPRQPAHFYLVDRVAGLVTDLFGSRPDLKPYSLAGMEDVVIRSRDGLDLVCYVTLPASEAASRPAAPLPMVLVVHGGPWARDSYNYRRDHQWLANRGYAVLSVNYRASAGFGKAFLNAGDGEHAAKIHDDLIDAVEWAIAQGIARRDTIAIMGGSYGGYAAFVGATFTPDVFCCSIPIVGITDLVTLMENRPPYWADFMEQFNRRYADVRTPEGRAFLRSRSPLYKADAITKPMLIGHGANDVRCTVAQSDLIVAAMQAKGLPVTYVVFPDEGHGFAKPENNIAFHAIAEAFLARHMGGRVEPVGEDFAGSSHKIRAGAEILANSG